VVKLQRHFSPVSPLQRATRGQARFKLQYLEKLKWLQILFRQRFYSFLFDQNYSLRCEANRSNATVDRWVDIVVECVSKYYAKIKQH